MFDPHEYDMLHPLSRGELLRMRRSDMERLGIHLRQTIGYGPAQGAHHRAMGDTLYRISYIMNTGTPPRPQEQDDEDYDPCDREHFQRTLGQTITNLRSIITDRASADSPSQSYWGLDRRSSDASRSNRPPASPQAPRRTIESYIEGHHPISTNDLLQLSPSELQALYEQIRGILHEAVVSPRTRTMYETSNRIWGITQGTRLSAEYGKHEDCSSHINDYFRKMSQETTRIMQGISRRNDEREREGRKEPQRLQAAPALPPQQQDVHLHGGRRELHVHQAPTRVVVHQALPSPTTYIQRSGAPQPYERSAPQSGNVEFRLRRRIESAKEKKKSNKYDSSDDGF